ncbi:MAG: DUF4249 domain-containing protein [Chitinophagaceae bacterium]
MKYTSLLGMILGVLTLSSCEKVISVNLNNTEKKYVVEGILTNQANSAKVLISQTNDFDDDNNFPAISGAQVTITDANGATTTLTEGSAGTYTASLQGVPGKTYSLKVVINGTTFTASSTMPQPVPLDTVYITDESIFGDTRKTVNVKYKDPVGTGNNYRFIQYVNSVKEKTIFVRNDDLSDGRTVDIPLWVRNDNNDDNDDDKIKSGDIVKVDMLCIDAAVYKYWFSLDQSATGESNVTPANPVSNIQGGALGYFSAHTLQSKTITVP